MGCHRNHLASLAPLCMFYLSPILSGLNDTYSRIIRQRDGPGYVQIERHTCFRQWMTLQALND